MKNFILIFLYTFCLQSLLLAQIPIDPNTKIFGPTTATQNEVKNYSASNFQPNHYWVADGGTILSQTFGSNATCEIKWTSAGTRYVKIFREGSLNPDATYSVEVSSLQPPPAVPSRPWIVSNPTCGNGKLRRGNPPNSDIRWYWQTSSTGKNTLSSVKDYSVSSTGTYYLRAKRTSDGVWSENASQGRWIKVSQAPATPQQVNVEYNYNNENNLGCSESATLTKPNQPSGVTFYWQGTNANGKSTANSNSIYTVYTSGVYYLRAKNNNANCWSSVRQVLIGIEKPISPPTPAVNEIDCSLVKLTKETNTNTQYWQGQNQFGVSTADNDNTYDVVTSGRYYLRTYNSFDQCWSDPTFVDVNVYQPDVPTEPLREVNCGNTVLTKQSAPSETNYYWQETQNGELTGDFSVQTTYEAFEDETIYLRAEKAGCWSDALEVNINVMEVPSGSDYQTTMYCDYAIIEAIQELNKDYALYDEHGIIHEAAGEGIQWSVAENKTYFFRTFNNPGICFDEQEIEIDNLNVYTSSEAGSDEISFANGNVVNLTGFSPLGGIWSGMGISGSNQFDPSNLSEGDYTIMYRYTNEFGCTSTDTKMITLVDGPAITVHGENVIVPGSKLKLSVPDSYVDYQWRKDGNEINNETNHELLVSQPGVYAVEVSSSFASIVTEAVTIEDGQFSIDRNYVRQYAFKTPGLSENEDLYSLDPDHIDASITYYDGLGRPEQSMAIASSPKGFDMVSPKEYIYGRELKQYLPYVSQGANGIFRENAIDPITYSNSEQYQFYQNQITIANTSVPYAERELLRSPDAKLIKQGAPGEDWQLYSGRFNTFTYKVNDEYEVFLFMINSDSELSIHSLYLSEDLTKTITTDEQYHQVQEFTNKQGQTILKRVKVDKAGTTWADTYYVYDDFGNLSYVLPPEAVKEIGAVSTFPATINQDLLVFQYEYDHRNRMIEKKVPGAEPVIMVYDDRDRLVLTQDGNQRLGDKWLFTKYDALNRPVSTGVYTNSTDTTQEMMQAVVSNYYDNLSSEQKWYESEGTIVHGYDNASFPQVSNESDYLTITYYDNYSFPHAAAYDFVPELDHTAAFNRVKGQVTGSKTRLLDGSNRWLATVNYYDDRYRVIQTHAETLIGADRITNAYDFVGQVLQTQTTHLTSIEENAITRRFDYDHAGRLINAYHQVNALDEILVAHNEYNELGELIDKKLHSEDMGNTFAQSVDYRYNIRGWLTNINDATLADGESDYFGMELGYNEDIGLGIDTEDLQYNGNISAIKWSEDYTGGNMGYGYQYDPMNRIKKAQSFNAATNAFNLDQIGYDLNGNIESLTRNNETGASMDILSYDYGTTKSNQLLAVEDAAGVEGGFKDGTNTGDDYAYDANGNMVRDRNKDIDTIYYNHLNLPERVEKADEQYIKYIYDATGVKLAQEVYDAADNLVKKTEYIGEFIYETDASGNTELTLIQHEEGRIVPDEINGGYEYQYHLKDHLGNTRVTFTTKLKTLTFGARFESETAADEEALYTNLPETRVPFNSADAAGSDLHVAGDNEVVQVNNAQPMGAGIALPVGAGDKVDMEVYAYYEGGSGYSSTVGLASFIGSVAGGFGGLNGGTEAQQATYDAFNNAYSGIGFTGTADDLVPAAFLNYILFDENMVYYQHGFEQVTSAANMSHERLAIPQIEVQKGGFIYVFLTNESDSPNPIYFDDMKVVVEEHPVIQRDDYYPFGLSFNSYQRVTAKENDYKYNGKELDDELGIDWYSYGARNYDAAIGRFFNLDRFSEKYYCLTPYQYGANNPIVFVDINGDSLQISGSQDAQNAFTSSINQGLGGFHTASVDENGLVTLESTGKEGGMTKEQQAFFDVVSEASSLENGLSSFDVVDGNDKESENIFFGDNGESSISATPGTHTIDIGDAQGLGTDGKLTTQGVIAHEVKEGFEIQVKGRSASTAHGKGIVAESKTTGTISLGATINSTRTEIRVPVQRGNKKSTVIMKFKNGNLKKVKNNEK